MNKPAIAVHGGSGVIPDSFYRERYHKALQGALDKGFDMLVKDGSALEAVCRAVADLEDCELFNAGKGSVFNAKGEHEMDAAVMEGHELKAGAVAGIQDIKNPVLLAKSVLQNTEHVFLAGKEAMEFGRHQNFEIMPASYFFTQHRYEQWKKLKGTGEVQLDHSQNDDQTLGTVGAVAVDKTGNVAAATSTGGLTNKAWGRIGDSGVIGAGTYANSHTCAVSCTGHGEYFLRAVTAYDVSCRMEYGNLNLEQAAWEAINKRVKKLGGKGGLIAIDPKGNITMPFITEGMYRGMKNNQTSFTAIH